MGLAAAAGIGAVGSIAGGVMQSSAAQNAANQQAQTAYAALQQQQNMFNTAQNALCPYYTAGQNVLPTLNSLLTPGPSQTATLSQLPGFQFQSQYGDLAATNQLAAQGLGGSGGPLGMALSNYNQGLAGTSFSNLVNALQGYANMGSNSASALAGNAVSSGQGQASSLMSAGNAQAAGTLGSANALSGALGGAGNSASNALLLSNLTNGGSSGIYGGYNYGSSDIANAAKYGVSQGLTFNPSDGSVY